MTLKGCDDWRTRYRNEIESYEDGDWILNYFDNRASAVRELVTIELSYDWKFFEDALFAVAAVGGKLHS